MTAPKTYHVKSFGCQMNVYDGERMGELLGAEGMVAADSADAADVVVYLHGAPDCRLARHPDDTLAAELESAAAHWGLDVLIEVHNEAELERALKLRSRMIGINNRDLHSFETTLATTERLAPRIPKERMVVGESGLFTPADLARLARVNVNAFLIGESLMRQQDVTAATRAILTKP